MPLAGVVGLALGAARGGHLAALGDIRLRWWGLLGSAVITQASLGLLPPGARFPLVLVSVAAAVSWAVANARAEPALRVGLALVVVGVALNTVAITANGGMPVSAPALNAAGMGSRDVTDGLLFKHVPMDASTSARFLGDFIPVPVTPFRGVISVGDLVMLGGIALSIAAAMGTERAPAVRP